MPSPERWTQGTVYADMWLDPDDDPREVVDVGTDERSVLIDYLRRYRLTFELKCADLDAEQLARRSVPPSTMSLLGMLRHLAEVERSWFRRRMAGEDAARLYISPERPDADWDDAVADPELVAEAWRRWREEVDFAVAYVEATPDLETFGAGDSSAQLRPVLVHLIEEYARHCGHADLLRETIDGRVGQ